MAEKMNFKNVCWLLFYLAAFFFILYTSCERLDPDLGWHLQVGREIMATRSVPAIEHFDYVLAGKSWVDHEWFSNALLYWLYNHLGYIFLSCFFAFLIVLILWLANQYLKDYFIEKRHYENLPFILLPLETLGLLAISPHIGVRIQEIGLLFLLLLLISLEKYERRGKIWQLLVIIPLLYSWSCLHGSFLIGIFILFCWPAVKIIEKFISRWQIFSFLDFTSLASWKKIQIFTTLAIASCAITLFTPYGTKLYTFLFNFRDNFYATHISEWLPAWYFPFQYNQLFYLALTTTVMLFPLLQSITAKKPITPAAKSTLWQWGIFLLFLLLAFKSRRHFPLFFIASLPLVVKNIANGLAGIELKFFINDFLVKFYVIVTFTLVITALILKTNFTNEPFTYKKFCQTYPCTAINFLKNCPDKDQKIFNNYNWGGFLIWVWPGKELFIDGRLPQYPYKNQTFLQEYYEFFDEKKVARKLEEYQIGAVLLKINTPIKIKLWEKILFGVDEKKINGYPNYLDVYLSSSPHWQLIYHDDISRIYKNNEK
ncbi:MAG: hypothetical protein NTW06_01070 [Candidatus Falkowbacteria bacterium]|nr:hypothetical protein [Candidatus Falkowbacteria bacterium]